MPRLQLAEHCRGLIAQAFDGIDAMIAPCVKGEAIPGSGHTGDPAFQQFWTVLYVPSITLPTHRGRRPAGRHPGGRAALADDDLFAYARWIWQRLGAT